MELAQNLHFVGSLSLTLLTTETILLPYISMKDSLP